MAVRRLHQESPRWGYLHCWSERPVSMAKRGQKKCNLQAKSYVPSSPFLDGSGHHYWRGWHCICRCWLTCKEEKWRKIQLFHLGILSIWLSAKCYHCFKIVKKNTDARKRFWAYCCFVFLRNVETDVGTDVSRMNHYDSPEKHDWEPKLIKNIKTMCHMCTFLGIWLTPPFSQWSKLVGVLDYPGIPSHSMNLFTMNGLMVDGDIRWPWSHPQKF